MMKWSSEETPLSVNVRDGKKTSDGRILFFSPPPKNNDCSNNNTSSQTTTRDRKQFWYGLSLSLLALSIKTSLFFCCANIFFRHHLKARGKRGSRSRCVIKCNLNWMARKKSGQENGIDLELPDKCLHLLEQQHSRVSFIDTHNMVKCPFVYASKWWLNFRTEVSERERKKEKKKREKRKNGKANDMKCIIK